MSGNRFEANLDCFTAAGRRCKGRESCTSAAEAYGLARLISGLSLLQIAAYEWL